MHHDFLDRYSRLNTPVHRASAHAKLLVALCIVALVVAAPASATAFYLAVAALLLAVALCARIPLPYLSWRLLWVEPFVVGVAILMLWQPGGLVLFVAVLIKSTLCLFTMVLLANTTPFAQLLQVLRRLHTPPLLVTTLALLYRYLFVLVDEAQRTHRARLARSFDARRASLWRNLGTVIGQLFVRSVERSERIYAAMRARGWQ